ncbi:hypothetical protein OH77DRAFT_1087464 [Trametes cingulata]|nr:hypothetical protein OH77DRAFT_1087464 [Trametes cingulata]
MRPWQRRDRLAVPKVANLPSPTHSVLRGVMPSLIGLLQPQACGSICDLTVEYSVVQPWKTPLAPSSGRSNSMNLRLGTRLTSW